MIKIAVLDDETGSRNQVKKIVEKVLLKEKDTFQIKMYDSSTELLMDMDHGRYFDLFLLDVEMPVHTGLEVAFEIRKYYPDPVIIYITDHVQYAVQAFEVNAYRYIPKTLLQEKLPEALKVVLPKLREEKPRCYIIKHYLDTEMVQYKDIICLKKEGKYVVISHRQGESRVRKSLQNVLEELDSDEFLEVGKGTAVNIRHVMSMERQEIVLRNGVRIPASRLRLAEIQERIIDYWGLKR